MSDLILHHYWPSPVAEKIRVFLGFKNLSWHSVEIPRVPPKPDVIALTGGYRRTPVMQIGADVFCDSQCILREIDRRFPSPSPEANSLQTWGLSRWTDGELFTHAIRIVLGSQIDTLDHTFLKDRARLYFGPDWTPDSISTGVEDSISQAKTAFSWMNEALSEGSAFMSGEQPGLVDALCYHVCWFIRGRYEGGPSMLDAYQALSAWEGRVASNGYGAHTELSSSDALDIANRTNTESLSGEFATNTGRTVSVTPATDGGDPHVEGTLMYLDENEIVVQRQDPRAGKVQVHFPRMGYRLIER